jgi:aldose 1-epimerase
VLEEKCYFSSLNKGYRMGVKMLLFLICFSLLTFLSFTAARGISGKKYFGTLPTGEKIYSYNLSNSKGMSATIINYGATVVKLEVPDRNGKIHDVILGYDSLSGYENGSSFFGGIVGRYGNRIAKGRFTLDGKEYQLSINDGVNHLHGGTVGFNKKLWHEKIIEGNIPKLQLTYISPDGEEGYPGKVTLTVTYSLTDENGLEIDYKATTDKPTIINPTNHCYFNLSGSPENTILDEILMINADKYTPVDKTLIPTGKLENVANTPMDFTKPKVIGKDINAEFEQLKFAGGYDHNWVLNNFDGKVRKVASVFDSSSGRYMEVITDQPGIQFYSGNFLDGTTKGKEGIYYKHRTGMCLECQHYPDSPNEKNFPTVVLRPGEVYRQTTIYKFSTR